MRKLPWIIIIVLLGVIAWFVFGDKKDTVTEPDKGTPVAPILDETPKSSGEILSGEEKKEIKESNQYLSVDAEYPQFENKEISQTIKTFVSNSIANFKSESQIDTMSQADKDLVFQNGAKYEINIDYKIYKDKKVSSVIFSVSTYTGGAHGGLAIKSLNFDSKGQSITIGDLFKPQSGYLAKLSTLSRTKLKATLKDNSDEWFTDGTTATSENFETFYLTGGNTLHIIFQPYQVGPWIAGTPEITIDIKNELRDLVSPNFLDESR